MSQPTITIEVTSTGCKINVFDKYLKFTGDNTHHEKDPSNSKEPMKRGPKGPYKFTKEQIFKMIEEYYTGKYTYEELGALYGVSRTCVGSNIRLYKSEYARMLKEKEKSK